MWTILQHTIIHTQQSSNASGGGTQGKYNETKICEQHIHHFNHHRTSRSWQNSTTNSSSCFQQIPIIAESTRYAQTPYPFLPFIIRFNAGKVTSNQIKEGLSSHCNQSYQVEINILNFRLSNRNSNNEYDFLLLLKDNTLFSLLLDPKHWPNTFGNMN